MSPTAAPRIWAPVDPAQMRGLVDARLQLHHAAQFASAIGLSLLTPTSDDSHTNLAWDASRGALTSGRIAGVDVAVALVVADLVLRVDVRGSVGATIPLIGHTIDEVTTALRAALSAAGADGARYTLRRHFDIPDHPVAHGARFDAAPAYCTQLAHVFADGDFVLGDVARDATHASEVRCWPHHFDIATLLTFPGRRSSSVGVSAGDHYYESPYAYVNVYPATADTAMREPLDGDGSWHTHEWVGAVLPLTRLPADAEAQEAQLRAFFASAVAACERLVAR